MKVIVFCLNEHCLTRAIHHTWKCQYTIKLKQNRNKFVNFLLNNITNSDESFSVVLAELMLLTDAY